MTPVAIVTTEHQPVPQKSPNHLTIPAPGTGHLAVVRNKSITAAPGTLDQIQTGDSEYSVVQSAEP